MRLLRGVVFDMDDTLCLERDYVRSGFQAVAALVAERSGVRQEAAFATLWGMFEAGVRGDTFDRLLQQHPEVAAAGVEKALLVEAYRTHAPRIALLPEMAALLSELAGAGLRMALITDGPPASQRAKIQALGLEARCAPCVVTDEWGVEFRKPHARAYEHVARSLALEPGEMAFVGDNPQKDFLAPRKLGWRTVRLRLAAQLRHDLEPATAEHAAAHEARSVESLRALLLTWARPAAAST